MRTCMKSRVRIIGCFFSSGVAPRSLSRLGAPESRLWHHLLFVMLHLLVGSRMQSCLCLSKVLPCQDASEAPALRNHNCHICISLVEDVVKAVHGHILLQRMWCRVHDGRQREQKFLVVLRISNISGLLLHVGKRGCMDTSAGRNPVPLRGWVVGKRAANQVLQLGLSLRIMQVTRRTLPHGQRLPGRTWLYKPLFHITAAHTTRLAAKARFTVATLSS
mmetsp:Transcript_91246/g.175678  ORF Transcript_91246/g.175678 Transcript_91246/m.175678 type:complete len:219 (-) Transcript_91246:60-716(-)